MTIEETLDDWADLGPVWMGDYGPTVKARCSQCGAEMSMTDGDTAECACGRLWECTIEVRTINREDDDD